MSLRRNLGASPTAQNMRCRLTCLCSPVFKDQASDLAYATYLQLDLHLLTMSTLPPVRRIVTGHNAEGKAIFDTDEVLTPANPIDPKGGPVPEGS